MKSFDKQLAQICDVELSVLLGSYKYAVFSNHTCVLEGHKGLLSYSDDVIAFKVSGGIFRLKGANLKICVLEKQFAVLKGDILGCEVTK